MAHVAGPRKLVLVKPIPKIKVIILISYIMLSLKLPTFFHNKNVTHFVLLNYAFCFLNNMFGLPATE